MSNTLQGTVRHVFDVQEFSSGFTKREFVIETGDKYPQMVKFETVKDKTAMLDGLNPGDEVEVAFNVRGNEYKDKFYVSLSAWKIDKHGGQARQSEPASRAPEPDDDDGDPIPF